jgi:amino acid adenylation domain-containing protein
VSIDGKQRLAALSDEQRQQLARRLSRTQGHVAHGIRPQVRNGQAFPLSFAQQRIWFLNQLTPLNTAFNVGRPIRLRGPIDPDALGRTINEVVRRHENLRTTYAAVAGVPMQRITPFTPRPLLTSDLRAFPPADRTAEAFRQIAEEYGRPWILETGPLFRAQLWRLADDDHILLVVMHHIVSDGWSWGLIERELTTIYRAFSAGQPSPLAELPIQYADFAAWQKDWIGTSECQRQLDYWKQQFVTLPKSSLLPSRAEEEPPGRGITEYLVLPAEVTGELKALCRREGATLFMALAAGFATLLSRYTGQDDIVIGSPIANRNRPEVEQVIGCFMNPLPLRIDCSGRPSFRELLRRVKELSLRVYENQDVPFDLLVRTLQPKRDPRSAPLFDVMLLLQNYPWQPVDLLGDAAGVGSESAKGGDEVSARLEGFSYDMLHADLVYPVAIEAYERGPFVLCTFQYEAPFATILSRTTEHFRVLIESALAAPDAPIDTLPMLAAGETERLRNVFAVGDARKADGPLVHRRFEAHATQHPDTIAIMSAGGDVSYAVLDGDANQLAHHLRGLGVGPEVRVAILLDRSSELITALLAVLKAGGAYVPLDRAYPVDRLALTLRDAQPAVLLTTETLVGALAGFVPEAGTVACLDRDADAIARSPRAAPEVELSGANAAYVIYTSGSTGTPKGVVVTHEALANYTRVAGDAFALQPSDRVLQFASISFDTAAEEIYPCLANGATLVLRTNAMIASAPAMLSACRDWRITVLDLPTAYWHELTAEIVRREHDLPDDLHLVILGGERAHPDRVRAWQARFGRQARLLNTYGPTESTIVATSYEVPAVAETLRGEIPIGRPIPNARAFVFDRRQQLVPIGTPGELYLGGAGLARGYLNRPELTAAAFVPDPFSDQPGARLYRTGDQARFLEDGTIEFLGRVDHQVKLRGYRIELAEIEAALMRHQSVEDAVVLLRPESGGRRLVGYVATADPSLTTAYLRRFLHDSLPDYMIPAAFVTLAVMPLTPNGKVDRDALPPPDLSGQTADEYVPPQTELQRQVAVLWQELLGVERVGLDDNFFDLGGHSLLVVQLHGRLKDISAEAPSVIDLFKFSTVRALAEQLGRSETDLAAASMEVVRERADRQREAFRRRRQRVAEAAVDVE